MQWIKRVFAGAVARPARPEALQPPLISVLEPRMMFDGAAVASAAEASKPTDSQDTADKSTTSTSKDSSDSHVASSDARTDSGSAQAGSGRNVVFVDSRVEDAQQLLQGVAANTDVVFLDKGSDGVQQMAQYLAAHPGAASVQIIAHGNAGDLWLGSSYVSAENITDYGTLLSQLGANMQAGGDILIYACSTAEGERGQTFVDELASLTGRDIAASDNATGKGYDWDLEVTTGSIEARSALSAEAESAYQHDLAPFTVTSAADSGAGSLRAAIASAAALDDNSTITFYNVSTVTLSSGQLTISKGMTIEGDLNGDGVADVTVDANYTSRVIQITGGNVTIDGLIIEHGLVSGAGGDGAASNSVPGSNGGMRWAPASWSAAAR
ncbi:MAG: hypothetical protein GAK45_00155 [Pseudomonas citronellolis]|nr:MAG: hypothetical protein GAK45_00155 [Pseudomonas citronellolis]